MPESKPFTIQFSVGGAIDAETGILQGVTIAEVGVATGHFACLDRDGKVLGVDDADIAGTAKRVPLVMDERGVELVVKACQKTKRIKAREDHDDSIGARAGFVTNFSLTDGKAVCDLNVMDNYRHRNLFIETAQKTPEMIGLSGDFRFDVEVIGDRAFMRVLDVDAVDIVDEGALTHAGLFRAIPKAPGVDIPKKPKSPRVKLSKSSAMANAPKIPPAGPAVDLDPDGDGDIDIPGMPDLDAFKTLCEEIGAYATGIGKVNDQFSSQLKEAMAAINAVNVPTPAGAPAPVPGPASNPDAKVDDPKANFAALRAEFKAQLEATQTATLRAMSTEMKKQFSALGIKPTAAATIAPEATPKTNDATPAADEPKTFLSLKAKIQKERKLSPGEAARAAMSEKPELFRDYQKALGIYDPAKAPSAAK